MKARHMLHPGEGEASYRAARVPEVVVAMLRGSIVSCENPENWSKTDDTESPSSMPRAPFTRGVEMVRTFATEVRVWYLMLMRIPPDFFGTQTKRNGGLGENPCKVEVENRVDVFPEGGATAV